MIKKNQRKITPINSKLKFCSAAAEQKSLSIIRELVHVILLGCLYSGKKEPGKLVQALFVFFNIG